MGIIRALLGLNHGAINPISSTPHIFLTFFFGTISCWDACLLPYSVTEMVNTFFGRTRPNHNGTDLGSALVFFSSCCCMHEGN